MLRRLSTGSMAIGLAVVVCGVPAAFAQAPRVLVHGKVAGTGIEAAVQTPRSNTGISLAVPIGRVSVGPEIVDGEPIHVRRTTVREGMTIVEVSTTPFMPVLHANQDSSAVAGLIGRPDQPASW
jgi:hypothetical protein